MAEVWDNYTCDGQMNLFDMFEAVCSNTQLYKQAGNSIVKNILCETFKQFIDQKGV